ncbi:PP2C family protein-serine/threonine phosphatase [Actinoallomurus soli]|uniref:PP2C family protein-serine/threonine phosphatase n=1 Tax=Actinoallomurus soli TaxID=2952535 RepID=UPI002093EBCA|nr:GAF domain-containing SpoIIE family protein phosphatase [Actinoallomurus soli]MCO5969795.1 SpoIIE family protein phosphatase [Actinoallomurus soli]
MVRKPVSDQSGGPVGGGAHSARLDAEDLDRIQAGLRQAVHAQERMCQLLDAVLAISSALDLRVVLHTITDTARQLVQARYAAVGVLGQEGEFAELITSGFGTDQSRSAGDEMPHGAGLLGDLVRDPRPLRVDNVVTHPHAVGFPEGHPIMTTLLGVPIRVRETVYGNLYLADKADGPFTGEDQDIVTALAGAAGVAIENARLYERLRQATEEFQRRLLPRMPRPEGLELEARYQPSTETPRIGGDWYDVIHFPGKVCCLVVGDVMGHGLESATIMSQISNMLRVIAFEEREPPSRILHRLDDVLHALHGGPLATVLVARLEPAAGGGRLMRWSPAGHLPPLLVTADREACYLHADAGLPLGVDPTLPRPDNEHFIPADSTVLLYTDGLVEHPADTLEDGMRHVAEMAAARATESLPHLCDALLTHRRGRFHDDVALLAARVTH